jgi:hypothetical protein
LAFLLVLNIFFSDLKNYQVRIKLGKSPTTFFLIFQNPCAEKLLFKKITNSQFIWGFIRYLLSWGWQNHLEVRHKWI